MILNTQPMFYMFQLKLEINKELVYKYASEQNFNEIFCEFENMCVGNLMLQYVKCGI